MDIAGIAVTHALKSIGFPEVQDCRIGKILEYNASSLEEATAIAKSQTNDIMENFKVEELL